MTQEEKARVYNEALKRASGFRTPECRDVAEHIFPELKESEDEKVRKEIQQLIQGMNDADHRKERWLTWLEKQAERKTPQWMIDFLDNYRRKIGCSLDYDETRDVDGKILCIKDWLEKQGNISTEVTCTQEVEVGNGSIKALVTEKIPIDKVEPKFHVNEWVIMTDKNNVVQIKAVNNGYYTIDNGMDFNMSYVDRYWHKWTIQDAKDGDVLQLGGVTVIFKEYIGNENCKCYCSVCNGEFEIPSQDGDDNSYGCYNATPATKEQRDLLFQKMKEAGYVWDDENKEPKLLVTNGGDFESTLTDDEVQKLHDHLEMHKELNDANVRKEFKWDSENKIMTIYGVTYEEMKALDDFIYCLRSGIKCPKGVEKARSEMKSEPQTVTFIDSGTMQVIDKLNEIIGKLGDIYQVLSKPFQFPYKDYTPPQEPWYKTHGVDRVTPVNCETINKFIKSEDNESK